MEYPFLSPHGRFDTIKQTYSIPLCLSRNYLHRFQELFPDVREHSIPYERGRAHPKRYIQLERDTPLWQNTMQPFLDKEMDKKLVALGLTREQWKEKGLRERMAARAWLDAQWENEASREAMFAEAARLVEKDRQEKAAKEARENREQRQTLLQKVGYIGYGKILVYRFIWDINDTFKSIWIHQLDDHAYKPRYLSSKNWMRFWFFVQEAIYPLRWKYSVWYQLKVFERVSQSLRIAIACDSDVEYCRLKADALKAMWDDIEQRVIAGREKRNRYHRRFCELIDHFTQALAPYYHWQERYAEAQTLKIQEELGRKLVETADALGQTTTRGALGGVQ